MVPEMLPKNEPDEVVEMVLTLLGEGTSFHDLVEAVRPVERETRSFPSGALLEIAADVLLIAGVARTAPMALSELTGAWPFEVSGRSHRAKSDYVVRTVAMIHAGLEPDVEDETHWWRVDDLWFHVLAALWASVAAAALRGGSDTGAVCAALRR